MIGQIIFDPGGLWANRNVSGKLGMKLAIDFFVEPCQLVVMWLMTLPSEHCHTGGIFIVSKFKKKRRANNNTR